MKIEICGQIKPFSHAQHGVAVILPGTTTTFIIHPSLIEVLGGKNIKLDIVGPLLDFTIALDVMQAEIHVYGTSKKGYLHYKIIPSETGFEIVSLRDRFNQLSFNKNLKHDKTCFPFEKLHLGVNKKQDIDLMQKRMDMKEVLPFLFLMGQRYKLDEAWRLPEIKSYKELQELYLLFFKGFFIPSLNDNLGIENPYFQKDITACFLASFKEAISALFIKETKDSLFILPRLLPEFCSGRMTHIKLFDAKLALDMEWSKKKIAKVILKALSPLKFTLYFPSEVDRFRVRSSLKEIGLTCSNKVECKLDSNQILYLDRFI